MRNKDITGQKFGRLTAIKLHHMEPRKNGKVRPCWLFKCDCGKTVVARKENVMNGHTSSCGCLHKESITRHGFSNTRLFDILHGMKQRCFNKKLKCYKNYGGRGITLCDDWLSNPDSFYKWAIKSGYKDNLTIDRIDNNGNYCPENCRWVTRLEQNRNLRKNRLITYKGETRCLSEWASLYHLQKSTLKGRLDRGWSVEEAFGAIERRQNV